MSIHPIQIGSKTVGLNHPCYIVAELSANHNQDIKRAIELIHIAKDVGADAIKLQTYKPETLTIDCSNQYFQISSDTLWGGKTLYELYGEAYTPWEWHAELYETAQKLGLECFSTPFDDSAVELLESLNSNVYKVASFEILDLALLRRIGQTGKPVIMSTGMASLSEIDEAVKTLRAAGTTELILLKCTSAYPAPPESMNLRTIPHLSETFNVLSGLSDHTLGSCVPVAAVVLGATVIEKHFTLARADGGADSAFSLEPEEFQRMVTEVRTVEKALGRVSYDKTQAEMKSVAFRRSLFVVKDIKKGEIITSENVRTIRPGHGLPPKYLDIICGKRATQDMSKGTPLDWSSISEQ